MTAEDELTDWAAGIYRVVVLSSPEGDHDELRVAAWGSPISLIACKGCVVLVASTSQCRMVHRIETQHSMLRVDDDAFTGLLLPSWYRTVAILRVRAPSLARQEVAPAKGQMFGHAA